MGNINSTERQFLENQFGDRVNFDRTERKLYGHDIASLPAIAKIVVGDTTPDAVVQPESEHELASLVKWAAEHNIPLTPRGKASSGYGGTLPVKKGLVVDFHRMKRVVDIDAKAMTATVEAGIVWEKVDSALAKQGLALRLYPSSYPGSTVGGWLAQGGAGIGSYETGWFSQNVVNARVVLADGSVKEFEGPELSLICDAEGTTGFISQLTFRVKPIEELDILAVGFGTAAKLQDFLTNLTRTDIPVWSILFINPRMAEMKSKAPLRQHLGHAAEPRVALPDEYIATIAVRAGVNAREKLTSLIQSNGGQVLSDEIAHHEWENRFKVMLVKRMGPSLVPAEFVIPLSNLADTMEEVGKTVGQPVLKEGIVIKSGAGGKPEVVILGFIPADQRSFRYNIEFGLALTIFKIAERHGGRPYSSGLYFAHKATSVMGADRVASLEAFKKANDPKNIMNPGKVTQSGLISTFMSVAETMEPIVRLMGNLVPVKVGERVTKTAKNIPADVAWYAYACSQCGYCVEECDQFYGRGWESQSPRGKWYWIREYIEGKEKWDQKMVDNILKCTTCEMCDRRCSASLPIEPSWMKLRGQLVQEEKKMTFPPFEMMTEALTKEGDIWAGYRKDRDAWFPKDLVEKHGTAHKAKYAYFAGCTASYVEHDIALASVRLLDAAGVDFTSLGEKESCCGTPMLVAGKWDVFAETLKKNVAAVKARGADTVITSCPACDMMWRHVYPEWAKKLGVDFGITSKHYSEVISEQVLAGRFQFPVDGHEPCTVTWHDSCHMGRVSGLYEPPRQVIEALPGVKLVEMEHSKETAHCCGSVLTLIKDPEVAADIGKIRLDEAVEAGANKMLALCPCCEFQLRVSAKKTESPVEVIDLARFAASYLGYEFPDPNPEVQAQWAVFEAMIALMTPKGFADLMGTMWPELIDAMPFGMGPMMRFMGKVPGALDMMKPMFPVLFPRLLPMMMPKVMPTMLKRVSDLIPMPDYMAQQMPELMPKVMDNLMPHMIGEVVPLVTKPMVDYLKGNNGKS